MITYREFGLEEFDKIKEIFENEGWFSYLLDDEALKRAFEKSLYCLGAFDDDELIGFVRCVGDGEHIVLVQDLIVSPEHQKQKIGTALFQNAWDKYSQARTFLVVTDEDDSVSNHFYQSFGMKHLSKSRMVSYFRV